MSKAGISFLLSAGTLLINDESAIGNVLLPGVEGSSDIVVVVLTDMLSVVTESFAAFLSSLYWLMVL